MLILVRSQTRDIGVKNSLCSLLGQVDSSVWLGEVTSRTLDSIETLLLCDNTSDSNICRLGRTLNVSNFYSISNNGRAEINFFEIYKNKSLLKNKK